MALPAARRITRFEGGHRMSMEEHKALVRRFEEAVWNGRNPARVDEFFAASHLFRAAGSPPLDRAGHRQMIAHFQDAFPDGRSEEHTSELQSRQYLVCRLLLEKKKKYK